MHYRKKERFFNALVIKCSSILYAPSVKGNNKYNGQLFGILKDLLLL